MRNVSYQKDGKVYRSPIRKVKKEGMDRKTAENVYNYFNKIEGDS